MRWCAVASIATMAVAAMAVGTAVKAGGEIQQAQMESAGMRQQSQFQAQQIEESKQSVLAQAQANEYNEVLAKQQADLTLQQYTENERRLRVDQTERLSQLRLMVSASGVTSEGSYGDVLEEQASSNELDALTLRHEGLLKSEAFRQSAALRRFEANQARATAGNLQRRADFVRTANEPMAEAVETAGYTRAGATLLSGAAQAYDYTSGKTPKRTPAIRRAGRH